MKSISINSLSKVYSNGVVALDNLNLSLDEGEIFGYLGPNGAGKTTTVNILAGILKPTEGSCSVMNIDPSKDPKSAHGLMGIMTEHAQMYDYLTGLENLLFYGASFGMEEKIVKQRANDLLNTLDLDDVKDRKLATFSTGMRQRLSLARTLIHRPQILLLDEPTSGLDPENARNVNQMIKTLAHEEGISVFLSTHQLYYAQDICTRFGLLDKGSLLASGTIEELRDQTFKKKKVNIVAKNMPDFIPLTSIGNNSYNIEIEAYEQIPSIVDQLVNKGAQIYSVSLDEPSLEDIYFALTSSVDKD